MNFIHQYIKDARTDPWFYIVEPLLFLAALVVVIYYGERHITFSLTIK